MAYYQYNEITKKMVSISDFSLSPDTNLPVSFVEITKADLENLYQWEEESLSFIVKVGRNITKKDFLKLFTPAEYSAVRSAAEVNGAIDYYWQLFMIAENINLDDADTIIGVQTLETLGLISVGRAAQILG